MSTHDPVANARRRAKALSRSTELTHQQALDSIAKQEGQPHWAAFLASHGQRVVQAASTNADTDAHSYDWRTIQLERMAGARHSPIDEWCISRIGGPIARMALSIGGTSTAAVIITVHVLTAILMQWADDASAWIFMLMVCVISPYLIGLNLAKPDGREQRMVRRTMISFTIMWSLLVTAAAIASLLGAPPFEVQRWKPLIMMLGIYPIVVIPYLIQIAAAWAGRNARRETR